MKFIKTKLNLFSRNVKIPWPILILYLLIVTFFETVIDYYTYLFPFDINFIDLIFTPLCFCLLGLFITYHKDNKDLFKEENNKRIFLRSIFAVAAGIFLYQFIIYCLLNE